MLRVYSVRLFGLQAGRHPTREDRLNIFSRKSAASTAENRSSCLFAFPLYYLVIFHPYHRSHVVGLMKSYRLPLEYPNIRQLPSLFSSEPRIASHRTNETFFFIQMLLAAKATRSSSTAPTWRRKFGSCAMWTRSRCPFVFTGQFRRTTARCDIRCSSSIRAAHAAVRFTHQPVAINWATCIVRPRTPLAYRLIRAYFTLSQQVSGPLQMRKKIV